MCRSRPCRGWHKDFVVAEPVRTELIPGRVVDGWGYNGRIPGPTIQVNEGDRVRIVFENHLPEMTAIHWHGFEVPMTMDGSVGLGQNPIQPGERFVYEFTLNKGSFLFAQPTSRLQEMVGMLDVCRS